MDEFQNNKSCPYQPEFYTHTGTRTRTYVHRHTIVDQHTQQQQRFHND